MSSIKWVFTYVNKYKFRFYSAFVAALICSLMSMINPYLSGVIVDDVIMKNKSGILSIKISDKIYLSDGF